MDESRAHRRSGRALHRRRWAGACYLDRPELNAERFVRNPFSPGSGARIYKTGDLVRYRATGEIEFIGRMDNQVKVRGFRVELGEIEAALAEHPSVREAVVVARKDEGDEHLVAYLTAREGRELIIDELRGFLQQKLPDHMVPSVLVPLESMPLTPIGKVDRRALPSTNGFKPNSAKEFAAPGDELELKLARIWEKVLGIDSIASMTTSLNSVGTPCWRCGCSRKLKNCSAGISRWPRSFRRRP